MDFYGNVISTYSDREAVEDGVLFPCVGGMVNGFFVQRASAALWHDYTTPNSPGVGMTNVTRFSALVDKIKAWGKPISKDGTYMLVEATRVIYVVPNGGRTVRGIPTATIMYAADR